MYGRVDLDDDDYFVMTYICLTIMLCASFSLNYHGQMSVLKHIYWGTKEEE